MPEIVESRLDAVVEGGMEPGGVAHRHLVVCQCDLRYSVVVDRKAV